MNVKVDGLTLHVEPDYNPPHPRTECDHLGKMLCWHRNYTFGDQNRYDTPEERYSRKSVCILFRAPLKKRGETPLLRHPPPYLARTPYYLA